MGVLVGTRTTYHSQTPRLLLLMSQSFIRFNYISSTMDVSEGTTNTYHSQVPRLLLLMSPSFIRVNYMSNTMDVSEGTWTTYQSWHLDVAIDVAILYPCQSNHTPLCRSNVPFMTCDISFFILNLFSSWLWLIYCLLDNQSITSIQICNGICIFIFRSRLRIRNYVSFQRHKLLFFLCVFIINRKQIPHYRS